MLNTSLSIKKLAVGVVSLVLIGGVTFYILASDKKPTSKTANPSSTEKVSHPPITVPENSSKPIVITVEADHPITVATNITNTDTATSGAGAGTGVINKTTTNTENNTNSEKENQVIQNPIKDEKGGMKQPVIDNVENVTTVNQNGEKVKEGEKEVKPVENVTTVNQNGEKVKEGETVPQEVKPVETFTAVNQNGEQGENVTIKSDSKNETIVTGGENLVNPEIASYVDEIQTTTVDDIQTTTSDDDSDNEEGHNHENEDEEDHNHENEDEEDHNHGMENNHEKNTGRHQEEKQVLDGTIHNAANPKINPIIINDVIVGKPAESHFIELDDVTYKKAEFDLDVAFHNNEGMKSFFANSKLLQSKTKPKMLPSKGSKAKEFKRCKIRNLSATDYITILKIIDKNTSGEWKMDGESSSVSLKAKDGKFVVPSPGNIANFNKNAVFSLDDIAKVAAARKYHGVNTNHLRDVKFKVSPSKKNNVTQILDELKIGEKEQKEQNKMLYFTLKNVSAQQVLSCLKKLTENDIVWELTSKPEIKLINNNGEKEVLSPGTIGNFPEDPVYVNA